MVGDDYKAFMELVFFLNAGSVFVGLFFYDVAAFLISSLKQHLDKRDLKKVLL